MMTNEECEKAMEEGTWLVWRGRTLVRAGATLVHLDENCEEDRQWSLGTNGFWVRVGYAKDLRIATPNDMLKYEPAND